MSLMLQNFILFQVGWFCCVIGGASSEYYWIGAVAVTVIIAIHLVRASNVQDEILLIMATMILGVAWDSALTIAGLFSFSNGVVVNGLVPIWMIAMWALFATTLNVSLKWMKNRYLLAMLFGGLGGPIAYYAGYRLGAVELSDTKIALTAVAIGWSIIMPLLIAFAARFNGYQHEDSKSYEVKPV
jgi:hypothetical protein